MKKFITGIALIVLVFSVSGGEMMGTWNWIAFGVSFAWLVLVAVATLIRKEKKNGTTL